MSKQVSLNGFVTSSSPIPAPTPQIKPKFTAIILKLEQPEYGRCCLCNRETTLPFCLEYLNDEGQIILWGDVCKGCANKTTGGKERKLMDRVPGERRGHYHSCNHQMLQGQTQETKAHRNSLPRAPQMSVYVKEC